MQSNPAGAKKPVRHFKWSLLEDIKLRQIVMSMKKKDWGKVAKYFSNRNPRQCQERWEYYLNPDVNNGPWSEEEDKLLFEKYNQFGSQWKIISTFFKGRTNTNVKNRYLALVRASPKLKPKTENAEFLLEPLFGSLDSLPFPDDSLIDVFNIM